MNIKLTQPIHYHETFNIAKNKFLNQKFANSLGNKHG